jgi:hypothetical protein
MTNGTLTFDAFGNLNAGAGIPQITINPLISGATPMTITWDVYDAALASNGSLTQYSSPSGTTFSDSERLSRRHPADGGRQ